MSVKPATSVFSLGSSVFITALLFDIIPPSLSGERLPQQQINLALTCSAEHAMLEGSSVHLLIIYVLYRERDR